MVAAVQALRRRRPLARPMLFIWLMVYLRALVRGLISIGWMPQNSVTLYGFQAGLAFAAFLLSLAMADQVMEFRKQRDRGRLALELPRSVECRVGEECVSSVRSSGGPVI